jgi:hypothetical protein
LLLGVELPGLEAVIQATEEPVEQTALCGSVAITGGPTSVVVGTGSGRDA